MRNNGSSLLFLIRFGSTEVNVKYLSSSILSINKNILALSFSRFIAAIHKKIAELQAEEEAWLKSIRIQKMLNEATATMSLEKVDD